MTERMWSGRVTMCVVALICLFLIELGVVARRTSITWDEDDHIYAGYMSLTRGDFGLNPEHPRLVKQLAAIPLLRLELKMPRSRIASSSTKRFSKEKTSSSVMMPRRFFSVRAWRRRCSRCC